MKGVSVLVMHSFRRYRALLAAVYALLFVFQIFMNLAAGQMERNGLFKVPNIFPEFIAKWTNMVGMSFQGLVLFGYSHPVVLLFLMALAVSLGSEPAGEIEMKFIDLAMSRPLRRSAIIHRTGIVVVLTIVAGVCCMLAGTWTGLRFLAPEGVEKPAWRTVLSLAANLSLEAIAWGAITLAVASFAKRRAMATSVCGLTAFSMFVLDYVGKFWSAMKEVSRVSPFHYFSPFEMIGGRHLQTLDVAVLLSIIMAGWATASVVYSRRDL